MKKSKQKPKPPMVITLELPVDGGLPRTGTLIVKHGEVAIIHQFSYRTVADVMAAINDGVDHVGLVEVDPPAITTSATAAIAQTPSLAPATTNDTPDEAAEADAEPDDETDQSDNAGSPEDIGEPLWEETPSGETPDIPDTGEAALVGAASGYQQQTMF